MLATYRKNTIVDGKPKTEDVAVEIPGELVAEALRAGLEAAVAAARAGGEMAHMANAASEAILALTPADLPPAVMVQPANALHRWLRREMEAACPHCGGAGTRGEKQFLAELDIEAAVEAQLAAIDQGAGQ